MTRLTGKIASYSPAHKNGKITVSGLDYPIVFHSDEFKAKIHSQIQIGRTVSFNVRKTFRPDTDVPVTIKAVNCVIEFEDEEFLNVEEISELFPQAQKPNNQAG